MDTKNNHLVNAAGVPLEFTFLDGQGGFDRMLLPFKRTLAQIGITLNLRRIDSAQYVNRLNARDYDMIVTSFPRSGDPIVSPVASSTASTPRKVRPRSAVQIPWCWPTRRWIG